MFFNLTIIFIQKIKFDEKITFFKFLGIVLNLMRTKCCLLWICLRNLLNYASANTLFVFIWFNFNSISPLFICSHYSSEEEAELPIQDKVSLVLVSTPYFTFNGYHMGIRSIGESKPSNFTPPGRSFRYF